MVKKTNNVGKKKFVRCFISVWNLMKTEEENVKKEVKERQKEIKEKNYM